MNWPQITNSFKRTFLYTFGYKLVWSTYSGLLHLQNVFQITLGFHICRFSREEFKPKAESMPDLFGIHNPWILLQNAKCWILVELTRNVISVLSCISSWPPVCKETFVAYSSCCRYHLFLFIIYGIREVLFCILYFKISQVTFPRHITSKCQN